MMDGPMPPDPIRLAPADLARLMPMHLWVDPAGLIRSAGPTLAKLRSDPLPGAAFFDVFDLRKPMGICSAADLMALDGHRVLLAFRGASSRSLRGLAVRAGEGQGTFLNLSFGLAVAEAVREHRLSHADFAATDLAVELLYLTEVKGAVMGELAALNTRLREGQKQAEARAMTDPLTGLANRRGFDLALGRALSEAERGGSFALMHLDLDHFKKVNDTHGHAAGDAALTHVAAVLRRELRAHDVAARIGGDEFTAIVQGACDRRAVAGLAGRIIAQLRRGAPSLAGTPRLSASIGAVLSQDYAAPDAAALLADVDAALYAAKRAGRGRCAIAPPRGEPGLPS